jgi:hypothetical protein
LPSALAERPIVQCSQDAAEATATRCLPAAGTRAAASTQGAAGAVLAARPGAGTGARRTHACTLMSATQAPVPKRVGAEADSELTSTPSASSDGSMGESMDEEQARLGPAHMPTLARRAEDNELSSSMSDGQPTSQSDASASDLSSAGDLREEQSRHGKESAASGQQLAKVNSKPAAALGTRRQRARQNQPQSLMAEGSLEEEDIGAVKGRHLSCSRRSTSAAEQFTASEASGPSRRPVPWRRLPGQGATGVRRATSAQRERADDARPGKRRRSASASAEAECRRHTRRRAASSAAQLPSKGKGGTQTAAALPTQLAHLASVLQRTSGLPYLAVQQERAEALEAQGAAQVDDAAESQRVHTAVVRCTVLHACASMLVLVPCDAHQHRDTVRASIGMSHPVVTIMPLHHRSTCTATSSLIMQSSTVCARNCS